MNLNCEGRDVGRNLLMEGKGKKKKIAHLFIYIYLYICATNRWGEMKISLILFVVFVHLHSFFFLIYGLINSFVSVTCFFFSVVVEEPALFWCIQLDMTILPFYAINFFIIVIVLVPFENVARTLLSLQIIARLNTFFFFFFLLSFFLKKNIYIYL
ncbi:hypothetical protein Tb10.70.4010 [Trypanosoma brucei brucei TREU927]|uniref:Uncharacterized protein n=1 Tax=Trypanosoma brucei brucei (strain 927/4 GUTat10.1) TaxID=185431 RepID=Q38BQ5_TRYB2|nr:hypothetical protein Tb10.70.4010 [Trypanosoma brucei brucei TREU927]EAN77765.1 hypothetical protein Tb10.70.4010 [Trypanosoma brucei brucei TREU927]